MEFGDFEPLFGEPKVECSAAAPVTTPLRPFLFQVHALDSSHLRVHVTDFFSSSWRAVRSIPQLDDMRDEIGIGGSWSEFLEYLVTSIKLGDVKLVLEGQSKSDEPASARLIAQKSKGMPRISIVLVKLLGSAANEAMASLSLDLYKAFKSNHKLLLEEQEGRCQFTKMLSAEQENNAHNEEQVYSKRHKSHMIHDKVTSDTFQDVSGKQSKENGSPMKTSNRVVPAHRRSRLRGVLLRDTIEEDAADD